MTVVMLSSMMAGMLARVPCHPIDTAKAQMQASSTRISLSTALKSTYKHGGIRGLYAGFGTAFFGSAPAACMYFTVYEAAKRAFNPVAPGPFTRDICAGFTAEAVSCLLWLPIDVVKERLQVQRLTEGYAGNYKGNLDALRTIWRTEGFRGMYRGYGATLASYGPYSAIYLSTYEWLKGKMAERFGENMVTFFTAGGVAGAMAAWITNPLDIVKLRLQVQRRATAQGVASPFPFYYKHLIDGLCSIWHESGIQGLFKGAGARVAFASPAAAVTIMLFDECKRVFSSKLD
jgi:hypothetical protein